MFKIAEQSKDKKRLVNHEKADTLHFFWGGGWERKMLVGLPISVRNVTSNSFLQ